MQDPVLSIKGREALKKIRALRAVGMPPKAREIAEQRILEPLTISEMTKIAMALIDDVTPLQVSR